MMNICKKWIFKTIKKCLENLILSIWYITYRFIDRIIGYIELEWLRDLIISIIQYFFQLLIQIELLNMFQKFNQHSFYSLLHFTTIVELPLIMFFCKKKRFFFLNLFYFTLMIFFLNIIKILYLIFKRFYVNIITFSYNKKILI